MSDDGATTDHYARFAAYYDLEYVAHTADLDFYREFAYQAGGPILELGCGSGRVLAALEETGLELTGVDSSPSMLAIARAALNSAVKLVECSMEEIGDCGDLPSNH